MAKPFFTARHLESISLLPDKLEIGRAYFIDDEQVIVIDHGRGPVVYGNAPGPQGVAGEPIPQLQDQIDALTAAQLTTQKTIWDINTREVAETESTQARFENVGNRITSEVQNLQQALQSEADTRQNSFDALKAKHDVDVEALTLRTDQLGEKLSADISDTKSELNSKISANLQHSDDMCRDFHDHAVELSANNAAAITKLIDTIHEQFNKYDSALNILAKSISELYPEHFAPEVDPYQDPLDNETVSTPAGSWEIQQTTLKDGTIILNLTPREQVIDTLKVGDSVNFDGGYWTVENVSTSDGVTSITIKP